jgi:hypothetical protein
MLAAPDSGMPSLDPAAVSRSVPYASPAIPYDEVQKLKGMLCFFKNKRYLKMPLILHDYLGVGHDLSLGAFDSVSVAKPGNASKLLDKYLPHEFKQSWEELSKDYKTTVKSYEPSMWKKMWANFGTTGVLKVMQMGAAKYSVGRPLVHKWIAGIATTDPAIGAVVAAAEMGLSKLLDTWGAEAETTTISAKRGQWVFIESEESYQRRRMGSKISELLPNEKNPPLKKSVSLGFFISPAAKNRVTVFHMDLGRPKEIEISQMLECDTVVAQRLDSDENLSTLREIFFYKYDGASSKVTKPFSSGNRVRYEGTSYILLFNKHGKSLLEDSGGKTIVVDTASLSRDFADSTPGETDQGFISAGRNNLYVGQWVFAPARVPQGAPNIELAVIHKILPEGVMIFYAMDGRMDEHTDWKLQPLNKHFQGLYNAKKIFMWFRLAASLGTKATRRYAIGKDYMEVCLGKDYTDALTTETPHGDFEEPVKGHNAEEERDTGNLRKEQVDFEKEMADKGLVKKTEVYEDTRYETEYDYVTGTVIVAITIAATAFLLYD